MLDESTYLARLERVGEIAAALERPNFSGPWGRSGEEPVVKYMLDDPVIHLVMRRDGVSRADIEHVVKSARTVLADPARV